MSVQSQDWLRRPRDGKHPGSPLAAGVNEEGRCSYFPLLCQHTGLLLCTLASTAHMVIFMLPKVMKIHKLLNSLLVFSITILDKHRQTQDKGSSVLAMWLKCSTVREWHWSKSAGIAVESFIIVNRKDAFSALWLLAFQLLIQIIKY